MDEQDVRQEALEERRRRLAKLLRANKAIQDGIQLSEAITGDGGRIFRHACGLGFEELVAKIPQPLHAIIDVEETRL